MSNRIQTKMVAEALSKHTDNLKPMSKKIVSTFMSVCTAFSKPNTDLELQQWQQIEFRKSKSSENSGSENWRFL